MTMHVKVAPNGRMVLPVHLRRRMGLECGGDLILQETEDGLVMTTHSQRIRKLKERYGALARQGATVSVDDFLADRRAEHRQELLKDG